MYSTEIEIAILCGGRGSRMGDLTLNRQKCMLEVEGRPILAHTLDQMSAAFGRAKVYFLTGYRGEDVFNYFSNRYRSLDLEYVPAGEMVETRLTLLVAENVVKGKDFISSAGDVIAKANELANLVQTKPDNLLGSILLATKHEVALTHGFATLEDNRVLKIEYPPTKPSPLANEYRIMDVGFFSRMLFEHLRNHNVPTASEVLKSTIELGEIIEGKIYRETWFHFAIPEDLLVSIKF